MVLPRASLLPLSKMEILFYKYQGTGNDFVIIDNRNESFPKNNTQLIAQLCDRRFGIGADGLLLLENHSTLDFKMVYYNADGQLGSMCGNGGRCMVHLAKFLKIIEKNTIFEAVDGIHKANIEGEIVSLKMNDVCDVNVYSNHVYLDTGSPHHVQMVSDLKNYDVDKEGAYICYNSYGKDGSNINFVEAIEDNIFAVRTYERGVESETLSCGTGVTAVAIALFETNKISPTATNGIQVSLKTEGGTLQVKFNKNDFGYSDIYLEGPATQIFKGIWQSEH